MILKMPWPKIYSALIRWKLPLFGAAIFFAYIALALHFFGYVCPSMVIAGVPCPGCGMTRAGFLALSGKFGAAWRMNPMIFTVPPYILLAVSAKKDAKFIKWRDNFFIASALLALAVFAFRVSIFFGEEPLVFYKSALLFPLISNFLNIFQRIV